jgi:hypothetical protein
MKESLGLRALDQRLQNVAGKDQTLAYRLRVGDVMRPYDVKLAFHGRSWHTVKLELGHNEIGDADNPVYLLATGLEVQPDMAAAVDWANDFISRIDVAT